MIADLTVTLGAMPRLLSAMHATCQHVAGQRELS